MDRFDWLELAPRQAIERMGPRERRAPPSDGPSFFAAARSMRAAGHFKAAADFYERAIGFQSHLYQAQVELTDTLVRGGHLSQADHVSHQALDHFRQVRLLYASRALVLAKQGRLEQAWPLLQVSLEGEPSWYTRMVKGEMLLIDHAQNRNFALDCFQDAIELAPREWETCLLAGWALLDREWPALAAGYFVEAAHRNPGAPLAWLCLGDCFYKLRFYDQALFYYGRVSELEPLHEMARQRAASCRGMRYGLLRIFRGLSIEKHWEEAYGLEAKPLEKDDYLF